MYVFLCLVCHLAFSFVYCGNITDVARLHTALLSGYHKHIRPIINQSAAIRVDVGVYLRSIQEINEVTEEFIFTAAFHMSWMDSEITWDPSDYGGIYETRLSVLDVWIPDLILTTTAVQTDTMVNGWQKVRYSKGGFASLLVGGAINAICSINVEKFPFDTQECKVILSAWGAEEKELNFTSTLERAVLENYVPNSAWDLQRTSTSCYVLDTWPTFEVHFVLERRSSFTLISFLVPLLLMNFLHVLVFLLVPQSGERLSFSITVLLAIAVFMTMISDILPASSKPVPLITKKLMVDLVISVAITLATILNLRVYHTDESKCIPSALQTLYNCRVGKRTKVESLQDTSQDQTDAIVTGAVEKQKPEVIEEQMRIHRWCEPDNHVTWEKISYMFDVIAFVFFSSASCLSFVVYIAMVRT